MHLTDAALRTRKKEYCSSLKSIILEESTKLYKPVRSFHEPLIGEDVARLLNSTHGYFPQYR